VYGYELPPCGAKRFPEGLPHALKVPPARWHPVREKILQPPPIRAGVLSHDPKTLDQLLFPSITTRTTTSVSPILHQGNRLGHQYRSHCRDLPAGSNPLRFDGDYGTVLNPVSLIAGPRSAIRYRPRQTGGQTRAFIQSAISVKLWVSLARRQRRPIWRKGPDLQPDDRKPQGQGSGPRRWRRYAAPR